MRWTHAQTEMLKADWPVKSAIVIAAQLGGDFTRNAVIGKAHRLKLKGKKRGGDQYAAKRGKQ